MVIGEWLEDNELFFSMDFSLTGMQEFFFPEGYKDSVKYSEKPVFAVDTEYGRIEVGNEAKFGFLDDVSSQIYSENKNVLNKLKHLFDNLKKEYPDAIFMFKKDIRYRIYLEIDSGSDIISFYQQYQRYCKPVFNIDIRSGLSGKYSRH